MATTRSSFRLLPAILSVIACIGCGGSSPSLGPTGLTRSNGLASGAVITGRVNGVAQSTSTVDPTTAATSTSTALRVTIAGTNISTAVDGAGQFTLTGVPPGTVTLTFTGNGATASITLSNVSAGDEIQIEIRLNGTSARIESEHRRRGDDDDDDGDDDDADDDDADDDDDHGEDQDEADEVEGAVASVSGTCPALTFAIGSRVVQTTSATVFADPCQDVRTGVRVEAHGSRTDDGTFTATRVEIED